MPVPILAPPGPRKPGKPGGGLRFGGLPAPVLIGGVVLAVAIGLYLRNKSATTAAGATTAAPSLADTGAASGGATGGSPSGTDLTPFQNLADSLNGLSYVLGGGGGTYSVSSSGAPASPSAATAPVAPSAPSDASPVTPYVSSTSPGTIYADPMTGLPVALQPAGVYQPAYVGPAGSYVSPATYAGIGFAPSAVVGPGPASIPAAPHSTATSVMPAQSASVVSHKEAVAKNAATAAASGTHTSGL